MAKGKTGEPRNENNGDGGGNIETPAINGGSNNPEHIGGVEIVDASKLAADNPGGRKERSDKGKPRGSRSGSNYGANKEGDTLSVDGLEALLMSVHLGLSIRLSAPEFELTQKEAHGLAIAWKEVERNYPKTRVPAKVSCLFVLAGQVGYIYGSRFVSIRTRLMRQANGETFTPAPQPQPQQSSVNNPAPAAASEFDFNFQPFGEEAKNPPNGIDFPITRQN